MSRWSRLFVIASMFCLSAISGQAWQARQAATIDASVFHGMNWRNVGPLRGGRTKAVAGIPSQPNVFYIGAVNGGVWKTTDAGRTWQPIFDSQPTGSIGALAVAPSDPNVIYAGSGEGLQRPDLSTGDGIYKSVDGGATWTHMRDLRDGQQIPQIIVDPANPNRLFVAVLGHPYGPNPERGVFRSQDGGQSFERVLFTDADTGASDLVFDPSNAQTIYAVLWQERLAPWENGIFNGPGSGVFKSTDGGTTWHPVVNGLPTFAKDGLGRIGITVAPSQPSRLFATVEARDHGGLYRSDNGGDTWSLVNGDSRVTDRGSDFAEVKVDPKNPDVVYTASVMTWKSVDGGRTFAGFRGAPGGDDYQRFWINPNDTRIILLAGDQGAIVTVNGGETWSSWYNQSTAQFYHVSTDAAFPYRICGGQQESGSACIASRGGDGAITIRDWHPVGAEEYGYIAPDPTDPDIIYGGKITRYDRRTGQVQDVTPPQDSNYRALRTAPVLFSPIDPRLLYFASQVIWTTRNGGQNWTAISPDLTRESWEAPATVGVYRGSPEAKATRRGVIYTVAPSSIDAGTIWAGTDDGLIHVTRDAGKTWTNVTPPPLTPWSKVSLIETSHFDANEAYAAINTIRLDDLTPHIYRTKDGGKSWIEITRGLPAGDTVNAVREDTQRRGLLFAGTERAVCVSFDDGESWQSLRLNMPASSVRDLVIKDNDLIAATHGRGFWVLDDITPFRQTTVDILRGASFLYRPSTAWREHWDNNTDTPLPPDEASTPNPPEGVPIDYYIGSAPTAPVTIEILNAAGDTIRRYTSSDAVEPPLAGKNVPDYWPRPQMRVADAPGLHRLYWDLRLETPEADGFDYPIAAVAHDTPKEPRGAFVLPGVYRVRLTAAGRVLTQPITVKMDPRIKTSDADLALQSSLEKTLTGLMHDLAAARTAQSTKPASANALAATTLADLHARATALFTAIENVDARPTAAQEATVAKLAIDVPAAIAAIK